MQGFSINKLLDKRLFTVFIYKQKQLILKMISIRAADNDYSHKYRRGGGSNICDDNLIRGVLEGNNFWPTLPS